MSPEKPKTLALQRKDNFYLWLDSRLHPFLMPVVLGITTAVVARNYFSNIFPMDLEIYQPLIAAMIYSFGTEVDMISTIRGINTINNFEQKTGVRSPFYEESFLAPKRPTWDFFSSFRVRALNAIMCTLSIALPPLGIGLGITRLYAGLHNESVRALHQRKLTEYLNG